MEKVGERAAEKESFAVEWPQFSDVVDAYQKSKLGKCASTHQVSFELKLGLSLSKLHHEIITQTYKPSSAVCFIVTKPKPREIFASHFRDRIVHHLIISKLEPIWEKKFIHASFACRKGKGTHGAIRYLQKSVRSLSQGGRKHVWVLKLDLSAFFVTINRPLLAKLIEETVEDPMLRYLVQAVYRNDSRLNVKKRGNQNLFDLIPKNKSWFSFAKDDGLPIGNLTSQFGANVYLTGLDQWIVRTFNPQKYLRYMDDLLLLSDNPEKLKDMESEIDEWLKANRHQSLNPKKTVFSRLDKGIPYLGYRCKQVFNNKKEPLQLYVEPKKKWQLIESLQRLEKMDEREDELPHPLSARLVDEVFASQTQAINSRLGLMMHANSFRLRKKSLEKSAEKIKRETAMDSSWVPFKIGATYEKLKIK